MTKIQLQELIKKLNYAADRNGFFKVNGKRIGFTKDRGYHRARLGRYNKEWVIQCLTNSSWANVYTHEGLQGVFKTIRNKEIS